MLNGTMDCTCGSKRAGAFHESRGRVSLRQGFQTNLGALSTIDQKGDVIIADRNIHASILDGCLASVRADTRSATTTWRTLKKCWPAFSPTKDV